MCLIFICNIGFLEKKIRGQLCYGQNYDYFFQVKYDNREVVMDVGHIT